METMQINNHKQTVISLLQEGESILQRSGLPDHARAYRRCPHNG